MDKIFIAADLGTTQITLMAATRKESGELDILAVEQCVISVDSIQYGIVKKPAEISFQLADLIKKMENRLKSAKIVKVYLSISGRSLRTIRGNVKRTFSNEVEITSVELISLKREIENRKFEDKTLYSLFSEEYSVDGKFMRDPSSIVCREIEANYLLAYGRTDIGDNMNKMIERTGYDMDDSVLSPIALSNAIISEEMKQNGVAMISFGASTTSVAVFQDNYLRHVAVVPFGSINITKDLCSMNLSFSESEQIKKEHGGIQLTDAKSNSKLVLKQRPGTPEREVQLADVYNVIGARFDEIVDMALREIERSGYLTAIKNGIVITGGGSLLKGVQEYLVSKTDMKVQFGSHVSLLATDSRQKYADMKYSLVVGLLSKASDNCVEETKPQEAPIVNEPLKPRKIKKNLLATLDSFFGGSESIDD